MTEDKIRRIGLLVLHGVGEQPKGITRARVVEAVIDAYPDVEVDDTQGTLRVNDCEIRVYEAHWADVLGGPGVDGSFRIEDIQQVVWFPLLNRRQIQAHRNRYPWFPVWLWTAALIFLGLLTTAAYHGFVFLFGTSGIRTGSLTSKPRKGLIGAVSNGGPMRLSQVLDRYGADVLNYVHAAGGAPAHVPQAEERIHGRVHRELERAVGDGCTEIQVLAHSLGSVIAYRSFTRRPAEIERIVRLPWWKKDDRATLTRFYTIGSPLEKFRFFWPKLVEGGKGVKSDGKGFEWHNFKSRFDPIAGYLSPFPSLGAGVHNHWIEGAGGLLTAHNSYLRHPKFMTIFGSELTGRPVDHRFSRGARRRALGIALESLILPALLFVLAAVGLSVMLVGGWMSGYALSLPVEWIGAAVTGLSGVSTDVPNRSAVLMRQASALLVPGVLLLLSIPMGYLEARRTHDCYWRRHGKTEDSARGDPAGPEESRSSERAQEEVKMPANPSGQNESPGTIWHLLGSVALLTAIAWTGITWENRAHAWVLVLALMCGFVVLNGHGITGALWGALIDNRFKMSLSRLQIVTWSLIVLSGILTAALSNIGLGSDSPMSIMVPPELWVLMGISTASAVAAPAVLSSKRRAEPDQVELSRNVEMLRVQGGVVPDNRERSVVLRNSSVHHARWSDLLKGDESGNAASIDLGKLQMFLLSFVLMCGYGAAIYTLLGRDGVITAFPPVEEGMNVLLGISHTGYLGYKASNHSKSSEDSKKGPEDEPEVEES